MKKQGSFHHVRDALDIYSTTASPFRAVYHSKCILLLGKILEQNSAPQPARSQYEEFHKLWRRADEDLPELLEAKARRDDERVTI